MTKRNSGAFVRRRQDNYPTPKKALPPLFLQLLRLDGPNFVEPCCGEGKLIKHLTEEGFYCNMHGDIRYGFDAMQLTPLDVAHSCIVTNPPWTREILHPMIEHFILLKRPVWLLMDADWAHTKQASAMIGIWCTHIVSVGRVRWMEGTKMDGFDNAAWYRFHYFSNMLTSLGPVFVSRSDL